MVGVRHTPGVGAGFAGLTTCGSVWACPVCSAKILAKRHEEVRDAIRAHVSRGEGHEIAMLTLTMRHHRGHSLQQLWDALSPAWARVTGGRTWIAEKAGYGVVGWLRVVELLHSRNGWHLHIHALMLLDRSGPAAFPIAGDPADGAVAPEQERRRSDDLGAWKSAITERWSNAVERAGLPRPLPRAQDLHLVTGNADPLAAYFTKQSDTDDLATAMAHEMTASMHKSSRAARGRTPWTMIDGIMAGDADELDLWHEYERASRGRRQMTWSRGLRKQLDLSPEMADEEIASEEADARESLLCQIR